MKTRTWRSFTGIAVAILALQLAPVVAAEQHDKELKDLKSASGTLTHVEMEAPAINLKQLVGNKRFNLANDCAIQISKNELAKPADLKTGMEVDVAYRTVDGVAIAHRVTQKQRAEVGTIKSIDQTGQRLVLDRVGPTKRNFKVGKDCDFVLLDNDKGELSDFKIGQRVRVQYVRDHGEWVLQRIENPRSTTVGTIEAIDAEHRTITTRHFLDTKRFSLARGCQIVVDDQPDRSLEELRIGQRVAIDYRESDGVLIASRVATVKLEAPDMPIGE